MNRSLIISIAALPLLAACASNMQVRSADTRMPARFEAPAAPDDVSEASIDRWWTLYNDPQLTQLVDQALSSGFDQKTALSRLEQAFYQRRLTRSSLLPQGNFSGSSGSQTTQVLHNAFESATIPDGTGGTQTFDTPLLLPGTNGQISATFDVSWELDLFGRRPLTRNLADSTYQSARFSYEATRTALAANVADSLFQARGYALQIVDAKETLRVDQDLERVVRLRVEHGLAAGSDLDQTAANTQSAEATVENLQSQLTTARRSLLLLVGHGTDPLDTLPAAASVGTPPPVPAIVPARLLERRSDVRQAEYAVTSQIAQFKLNKKALFPTINLQPGVTLSQTIGSFNYSSALWNLGLGLTVPVLDRPRLLAQIGVQKAVTEQDVIAFEQAVQQAYVDSENALVLLDSDRRRAQTLHSSEARARAAYDKIHKGYVLGLTDLQTALIAENNWRTIRIQSTAADITVMQRSVQLFKAIGGGWSPDAPALSAPTFGHRGAR